MNLFYTLVGLFNSDLRFVFSLWEKKWTYELNLFVQIRLTDLVIEVIERRWARLLHIRILYYLLSEYNFIFARYVFLLWFKRSWRRRHQFVVFTVLNLGLILLANFGFAFLLFPCFICFSLVRTRVVEQVIIVIIGINLTHEFHYSLKTIWSFNFTRFLFIAFFMVFILDLDLFELTDSFERV